MIHQLDGQLLIGGAACADVNGNICKQYVRQLLLKIIQQIVKCRSGIYDPGAQQGQENVSGSKYLPQQPVQRRCSIMYPETVYKSLFACQRQDNPGRMAVGQGNVSGSAAFG